MELINKLKKQVKNSILQGKRLESRAPSCISMKSDDSMETSLNFKAEGPSFLHRLFMCGVSDIGCAALSSALRSNPSLLRELNLSSINNVGDSGVKNLSAVLENPLCKLYTLRLLGCGVSDEGCALRSNPPHLRELNLSYNNVGDSGVKSLSAVLENPLCKLETLRLRDCGVSDEGCGPLTSALKSNPSLLRDLDLSFNNVGDSGVKLLSALKDDKHYKLQTLRVG